MFVIGWAFAQCRYNSASEGLQALATVEPSGPAPYNVDLYVYNDDREKI